jgi:hypothetical protein
MTLLLALALRLGKMGNAQILKKYLPFMQEPVASC